VARRQRNNLLAAAVKQRITDDDRSDVALDGSCKSSVDLAFRAGLQDLEPQAFRARCLLRRVNDASYLRSVRVQEQADNPRLGNQLGDQLDPLLP
jgi:hypothetical protein